MKYNLENISRNFFNEAAKNKPHTIWKWSSLLPPAENKISLGEGNTPIFKNDAFKERDGSYITPP